MSSPKLQDLRDWTARLVLRKYTEMADPDVAGHFSARIEHDGAGCYFPLGSADETSAARRAWEIHRWVQTAGWSRACQRFAREFTLAVFWSGNPLLCTYTTLLTSPGKGATAFPSPSGAGAKGARLVIIEADAPVRRALVTWARRLPDCACVAAFPSPGAAQSHLNRAHADLVLLNRSLPAPPDPATAPRFEAPAMFAFGVYETSDDIFISHTGVSHGYFLHRTAPERILAPATNGWQEGARTLGHVPLRARAYFQELIAGFGGVRPAAEKATLTPREEEILLRLSKGYPDKQIADSLAISAWTVHNHIKNIFRKLGVHSRTQAVIKHLQK